MTEVERFGSGGGVQQNPGSWNQRYTAAISRRVGSSQEPNARAIPTRCEQLAGGSYHGNPGELQLLLLGLIVVVSAAAIRKTLVR